MKLSHFNIGNFKVDGGAMFGVVPKALWSRVYPSDDRNLIPLAMKSLVIEAGNRVVLIDCGIGDKLDEKVMKHIHLFGGEGLLPGLKARGYNPGDITDVVLTHLHYDHCGGGTCRDTDGTLKLTFPNAQYHVSRSQWEWANNPNPREADAFYAENLDPLKDYGVLNLLDENQELIPGVELRIFNGHTRGQLIPIIRYGLTTLVFAADLIPLRAQVPLAWLMSYDIDPLQTLREKELLLTEALENNWVIIYQHDYRHDCSRLVATSKGVRASEGFSFDTLMHELESR